MQIKLPTSVLALILAILAFSFPVAKAYAAPNLQFDQTSVTAAQNATFQLNITINVDTNTVMGSDAVVNYAAADLQVTDVSSGGFFPQFTKATDTAGKIEIHGFTGQNDSRTGTGTFATITFKALKNSGSSNISYTCTGSGTDTDIITTTGQNILVCTQLNNAGISYASSGTSSPTPTATTAPGVTATPTPTTAPSTGGNTIPTCSGLTANVTSSVGTPLAVTFTCSGTDPDGYMNGALFTFGDGTNQTITKNVGSPGSIATTHTYTTIGALGASCIVQDNNNAWSNSVSACTSVITIQPTPSPTPRQSIAYISGYTTGQITPTPTPVIVSIISETPEPTFELTPTPTPVSEGESNGSGRLWWIIGGVIAVVVALILILRRKNPPPKIPLANEIPIAEG
ncbi:MAG TPA: cohesin domain-containing protein [Patescibacteria group bacterium]|nr:cohesin domain-containing protein [Patescibacteria group bacterium]